jgi:lipopolysaccharide exporter
VFSGAVIVVTMRWTDRLIGLISTLVLARLLVPEDFGIVAMASIVVGLVDTLTDFGIVTALIHRQGIEGDDFSTAWTIRLIQCALVASIVVVIAPFATDYFNDERVKSVLWLMAITTLASGFENIGIVAFQKEMRFGKDFQFFFLRRVGGFVVTIALALWLRSYWALPLGALFGRVIGVGLSYLLHPFRPRFTLARFKRFWSFSQWMLVRSIGSYLDTRLDRLILGRRADASVVGAYAVSDEIASMPTSEVLAPIGRVLFPALVEARERPGEMSRIFLLALASQVMLAIPAATGLALVANNAVIVLLGMRWMSAVPLVQVLALLYGFAAVTHATGYLLLTLGYVRVLALFSWAQITLFAFGAIVLFPGSQALGLAYWRLTVTSLGTLAFMAVALRLVGTVGVRDVLGIVWRPVGAAGAMATCVVWLPVEELPAIGALLLQCLVGAICYVTILLALWKLAGGPDGPERYVLSKVARLSRRQDAGA